MFSIPGYSIKEKLYESHKTVVYRGIRGGDRLPIVLKLLKGEFPSTDELAHHKREYQLLKELEIEGVVKAYDQIQVKNTLVIVLEDFGGISLQQLVPKKSLSIKVLLEVCQKVTRAIGRIHQKGIIHKDINPSNIIYNPESGEVRLIDFCCASRLARETPSIFNINELEGTLAYLAPEQSGRMNRSVDYRSDFYSLGVTFFELFTGKLPFHSEDPVELIHSHMARKPDVPLELSPSIPLPISQMILKLLAKTAEERYQSAFGIAWDLNHCLELLKDKGEINNFEIATQDLSSQFQIPEKFYGRETEIRSLLNTFDLVAKGGKEMLLISGYVGVGKTYLVNEIHKPILGRRGFFISGKFDQFKKDVPYDSLIQAFRELVHELLIHREDRLAIWKNSILETLGDNVQVITEIIPELELILGPQQKMIEFSPDEVRSRFHIAFRQLISLFGKSRHPLVIFLDDLQWADSASLQLIQSVFSDTSIHHVLFLGAFRDEEISPEHPMSLLLESLKKEKIKTWHLHLLPLKRDEVHQLVNDTLTAVDSDTDELSQLIFDKTLGNPFFVNQFFRSLYEQRLLNFSEEKGVWKWDIKEIMDTGVTENVVELMSGKLTQLPEITQQTLQIAACIGNLFRLSDLSTILGIPLLRVAANLRGALLEGLIIPLADDYRLLQAISIDAEDFGIEIKELRKVSYRFLHDRVQQAAYALIPKGELTEIHLKIGRLLKESAQNSNGEVASFDIVNHLNFGSDLISSREEKTELAQLNLRVGYKAKSAFACDSALSYLTKGIELLGDDGWKDLYELSLDLHLEAGAAYYLISDFTKSDQLIATALGNVRSLEDKVRVYDLRMQSHYAQRRMQEALNEGVYILKLLGHRFPKKPTKLHIIYHYLKTKFSIDLHRLETQFPPRKLEDPKGLLISRILDRVGISAYRALPRLLPIVIFKGATLAYKDGVAPEGAFGYAGFGMFLCGAIGDIENGYRYGMVASRLMEEPFARKHKAKTWFLIECNIRHWKEPLRDRLDALKEIHNLCLEVGDIEYGTHAANFYGIYSFFAGVPLQSLRHERNLYKGILRNFGQETNLSYHQLIHQVIANLTTWVEVPYRIEGAIFRESEIGPVYLETRDQTALFLLELLKMVLSYHFEQYHEAKKASLEARKYLEGVLGFYVVPIFYFYDSLVELINLEGGAISEKKKSEKQISHNQRKLKLWSKHAPMNHEHKYQVVEAERARIKGVHSKAMKLFQEAIENARVNDFLQEQALINELAGKFYLSTGMRRHAAIYITEARYLYQKWGAKTLVNYIDKKYESLISEFKREDPGPSVRYLPVSTSTSGSPGEILDLYSLLKASRTLSSEVELDKLLSMMMSVIIENAGAEKANLIYREDKKLIVLAKKDLDNPIEHFSKSPLQDKEDLPQMLIRFVIKTGKEIIISDISDDERFYNDPYFKNRKTRSTLCIPIIHKGETTGALYLENNQVSGAFTPQRVEILQTLLSQAAISIENARLYSDLKQSEQKYRSIFENAAEGIFQTDFAGNLITANSAFAKILGYPSVTSLTSAVTLVNRNIFANPQELNHLRSELSTVKRVSRLEFECLRKDGTSFPASISVHLVKGDNPNVEYWEGILEDISESKKAEQLTIAKEAAETANQAKSEFLANISHELRTPMHGILGFTKLAINKLGKQSSDVIKEYLNEVFFSGDRLLRLLNELLDLAKLESGKSSYTFDKEELSVVTKVVIDEFEAITLEKKLQIDFSPPSFDDTVMMDKDKVMQVVRNLISNAVKFSNMSGMIRIEMENNDQGVCFVISDSGVGIPDNELTMVFDKFAQSSKTNSGSGGTGLGLAICKQIVNDHGGDIWAENNPEGGAIFKFNLPKEIKQELDQN